jgi:hypothetical protein
MDDQGQVMRMGFDTHALRADADEMEACGGGNEATRMRDAANEIERLRLLVETAFCDGALHFGGFTPETNERALAKFRVSDSARWLESREEWEADISPDEEAE